MAVTFTSLADWEHAQDTDAAQEIVLAYSERRQCVNDAAIDALAAGDVKQNRTFWRGVQDWIETNCVKWVDDSSFSTSTEYEAREDVAYTLSTFRAEAGLDSGGFRRATEWPADWTNPADPAYSFGKITRGDIIGPWIFEDLQKAFDAMRWTYRTEVSFIEGLYASANNADYDQATLDWPIYPDEWMPVGFYAYGVESNWGGRYQRGYMDSVFEAINDHLSHSAEGYYWVFARSSILFVDIDGLGMHYHRLFPMQSFESANTTTRTIDQLTNIPTIPPFYSDSASAFGAPLLILKWEFSHTL